MLAAISVNGKGATALPPLAGGGVEVAAFVQHCPPQIEHCHRCQRPRSAGRKRTRIWVDKPLSYVSGGDAEDETPNIKALVGGLDALLAKVHSYCPDADDEMICNAYHFAEIAHKSQTRRSGEPYLIHPVSVANIIADMRLDVPAICTALLHDTVEDCDGVCFGDIQSNFGEEVAALVDGMTKISGIKFNSQQEEDAENYRKLIVAMGKDIRVVLVKLADRLHNIRTLQYMPRQKQINKARETLEL